MTAALLLAGVMAAVCAPRAAAPVVAPVVAPRAVMPSTPVAPSPASWRERPCDPWMVRAPLPGTSDALVLALHDDLWTAYDLADGRWLGARRGGSDPMVPESAAPWDRAPVHHEGGEAALWRLTRGDTTLESGASALGVALVDGSPRITWELAFDDGTRLEVHETPDTWRPGLTHEGRPIVRMDRVFEAPDLPDGETLEVIVAVHPGLVALDGEAWAGPVPAIEPPPVVRAPFPVGGRSVVTLTWMLPDAPAPALGGRAAVDVAMGLGADIPGSEVEEFPEIQRVVGASLPLGGLRCLEGRTLLGAGGALYELFAGTTDRGAPTATRLLEGLRDPVVPLSGERFVQAGVACVLVDGDEDGVIDGWRRVPSAPDDAAAWASWLDAASGEGSGDAVPRAAPGDARARAAASADGQVWACVLPPTVDLARPGSRGVYELDATWSGDELAVSLTVPSVRGLPSADRFDVAAVQAHDGALSLAFTRPLAADLGWEAPVWELRDLADGRRLEVTGSAVTADRLGVQLNVPGLAPGAIVELRLGHPLFDDDERRPLTTRVVGRVPAEPTAAAEVVGSRPAPATGLSRDEARAGFVALGPDAWRRWKGEGLGDGWTVDGDSLSMVTAGAGDLVSTQVYGDFEWRGQWRIGPGSNSGLFYRALEEGGAIYMSAPEMQVLDTDAYPGLDPRHAAGGNYALHAPPEHAAAPVGLWNHFTIRVQHGRVTHRLNGVVTADYLLGSPEWQARVEASKFGDWALYGTAAEGHLGLQDHGDPVTFRALRVRRLD